MGGVYNLTTVDRAIIEGYVATKNFNYGEQYVADVAGAYVSREVREWFEKAAFINSNYGFAAGYIRDTMFVGNLLASGEYLPESEMQNLSNGIGFEVLTQVLRDGFVAYELDRYIEKDINGVFNRMQLNFWAGKEETGSE